MLILKEHQAELFLKKEGFPVVESHLVRDVAQLIKYGKKLGFPVVLKNPDILHKTEKNAVKTNVYENNLDYEYDNLKAKNVLIQKQIKGHEFLVGVKKDNVFGHVIAFGIGGIFTEVLKEVSFRVLPVNKKDAIDLIKENKAYDLLNARGKKIPTKKIENIILKISELAERHPNIIELDINPLIVNEREAKIVDARIVFNTNK